MSESINFVRQEMKADRPVAQLVLAHGAGAGMNHEFMQAMASELANEHRISVTLFNFPYMQTAMETNKRRPPNKSDILIQHFSNEILRCRETTVPLFIGGKSMGGRIATLIHQSEQDNINELIKGTIVYGYPFIPPGKPEKLEERISHLVNGETAPPILICQGERDTFGNKALIKTFTLPEHIFLEWINDGDHSFKPRKSAGVSLSENIKTAAQHTSKFINKAIV